MGLNPEVLTELACQDEVTLDSLIDLANRLDNLSQNQNKYLSYTSPESMPGPTEPIQIIHTCLSLTEQERERDGGVRDSASIVGPPTTP